MSRSRLVRTIALAAGCVHLLAARVASAQCEMSLLSHFGAAPRCQAVQGNRLYAVFGDELLIYNISSQPQPTLLGRGFFRTGRVEDIAVSGTTVFLAGGESGLVAIDASTPSAPVELDRVQPSGDRRAMHVVLQGTRAYTEDCGEVRIFDASNPANLFEIGQVNGTAGGSSCVPRSFDVQGTTLFKGTNNGVQIYDVSSAAAPSLVATYRSNTEFAIVEVQSGLMAAWNENTSVVHLVDVQTPSFPVQYSTFTEHAVQIAIDSSLSLLYMRDDGFQGTDNVFLWEINNPSSPLAQGIIPGETFDVDVSSSSAMVARYEGIELWNTANPNLPLQVWTIGGGYVPVQALHADHRYLAAVARVGVEEQIVIHDVSVPGVLTPIAMLPMPDDGPVHGWGVYVRTPYVFVSGHSLHVIDLAAPGGPEFVGSATPDTSLVGEHIQVWENLAVVAAVGGTDHELAVFDIQNPQAPQHLGTATLNLSGFSDPTGVAIGAGVAYLSTAADIAAVSLADPTQPFQAFRFSIGASDISLSGTTLAVQRGDFTSPPSTPEIRLYFVPDPLTAILMDTYTESVFNPKRIDASGNYLAFFDDSGHQSHVSLVDISDAQNAVEIDRVQTNARCQFLALTPDRIWRAEYFAGDSTGTWEYGLPLPPEVVEQPASIRSCQPGFKQFRIDAGGAPTYRWRRNGVNLNNGPTGHGSLVAGALSATLSLFNAGVLDNGSYDCVVTNGCGSLDSNPATLTICGECDGDVNCDCRQDLTDLATLLTNFGIAAGATRDMGDLTGDGAVDLTDLATLLSVFGAPCQ